MIIKPLRKDNLNHKPPQVILSEIKDYFLRIPNVKSCYLFGSFLTDEFGPDSDIDLIVIINNSKRPFLERPLEFTELYNIIPALDLLVYTQKEFNEITDQNYTCGFWHSVMTTIRKIY